jgi:hypothetical protein
MSVSAMIALVLLASTAAALEVKVGEPTVVAVAPNDVGWGYYQFPSIGRWDDGTLSLTYSSAPDAAESYGTPRAALTSKDGGKTWSPHSGKWGGSGLLLPNGDRIAVSTPKPYKLADLKLPEPVGTLMSTYGGQKYTMYRGSDLPPKLRTIRISRQKKGSDARVTEHAWVDDPQALRYSLREVFPIIWWGDVHLAQDGSLIAGIYPGNMTREDGSLDPKWHIFFYRSTDFGHSWKIQGRILYQPDMKVDPNGDKHDGFGEPAFEILNDGSLLCIMRCTDGAGIGPMYSSRSTDLGKTWSKPRVIAPNGVLPKLLKLENGILALSSGRPGVQVRFSEDGKKWTEPFDLVPVTEKDPHKDTCGYTSLLAVGPNRFLIAYSHFKHPNEKGELRKAIMVREIEVR